MPSGRFSLICGIREEKRRKTGCRGIMTISAIRSSLDLSWVFSESLRPAHLEEGAERNYPIGVAAG